MRILTFILWCVFSSMALFMEYSEKDGRYFGILGQMHLCAWMVMKYVDEKSKVTIKAKDFLKYKEKELV